MDSRAFLWFIHESVVRAWWPECWSSDIVFVEETSKEIKKLIPLSTLFLEWENANNHSKYFEVEYKIVQMLSCVLLPHNLEIALLEALEVEAHISCQEVQAILNWFDFTDYKLHDLQRVSLLVNLFDYLWLFNQNRVNERYKFVFKGFSCFKQLSIE